MKLKRIKTSKKGRIEIIPMIDVMFFLLVTFMLASLSMQKFSSISVNLTQGKSDKISLEQNVTFTITHDNLVFLGDKKILIEDIENSLKSISNQDKKKIIIIADKDSKQGISTEIMLMAKKANFTNFSILTKE